MKQVFLMLVALCALTFGQQNLLVNSGFEADETGKVPGWEVLYSVKVMLPDGVEGCKWEQVTREKGVCHEISKLVILFDGNHWGVVSRMLLPGEFACQS
ncbi:MAG: hypothetical protein GX561_06690 [Lentisphaerae bacterium]|nr:hypothetical protein [Lentisphaerota bacterium]